LVFGIWPAKEAARLALIKALPYADSDQRRTRSPDASNEDAETHRQTGLDTEHRQTEGRHSGKEKGGIGAGRVRLNRPHHPHIETAELRDPR